MVWVNEAMTPWNFVTTNAGANSDGYDSEDRFQCAFNGREPQLAAGRRSVICKKKRKRKLAQSTQLTQLTQLTQSAQSAQLTQTKTFNFTRFDIGNNNNINLNERFSKWGSARTFNTIHANTIHALTQITSETHSEIIA